MEKKPKLFFMVSRFPYPLIKGDKLRAFHQIRGLSDSFEIYLCALSDEKVSVSSIAALEPFCKEIRIYNLSFVSIFFNLIRSILFGNKPVQTAYFYNSRIRRKIENDLKRIQPDFIYNQLIRTARYVINFKQTPKILDYMDALSAGMERRAEQAGGILKWLYKLETTRLKKYEHQIFFHFDQIVIISASDRAQIFHYDNENIHVVPNGIDMSFFNSGSSEKKFDVLFTGNMSYPPNIQSALYLAGEIMPQVWKKRPDTTLLISGANPVKKIRDLARDRITVQGWTDDLRPAYASSRIFVAPMNIGSGLQNKLLEAMSMKLPCIASELANRSLNAEDSLSILIGKSTVDYAEKIIYLLENTEKAVELAEKGHSFVAANFQWTASNQKLKEIILHGKA